MQGDFLNRGWCGFAPEPAIQGWVDYARRSAEVALCDPENAAQWQCERTWFVGLEALANDHAGRLAGGPALEGAPVSFAATLTGGMPPLHRAQLSVIRPGYPKPRDGETSAAFGYRLRRDAAHVDGILGIGTPKRRFLTEPHSFVLGIPLTKATIQAAPLVVWEGSHLIMRKALVDALRGHEPDNWPEVDVTDAYQAARKICFDTCKRVAVHADVGGAYVVHRLALHGVAPWQNDARADPLGRMIAYFRPELPGGLQDWLHLD